MRPGCHCFLLLTHSRVYHDLRAKIILPSTEPFNVLVEGKPTGRAFKIYKGGRNYVFNRGK
jgi:hypothetical protein